MKSWQARVALGLIIAAFLGLAQIAAAQALRDAGRGEMVMFWLWQGFLVCDGVGITVAALLGFSGVSEEQA